MRRTITFVVLLVGVSALAVSACAGIAISGAAAAAATAAQRTSLQLPRYSQQIKALLAQPNAQTASQIDCPGGTVPLDGGVAVSYGLSINASYPVGNQWLFRINNPGNAPEGFMVELVCAAQPQGYQIIHMHTNALANAATYSMQADCPAGTLPLGGGAAGDSSSTAVALNSSAPKPSGWNADLNNASNADVTFWAYAVCGVEPGYMWVQGPSEPNPPGTTTTAHASCLPSKVVIGGGGFSNAYNGNPPGNGNLSVDLATTAFTNGAGWVAVARNDDPTQVNVGVQAFAICAGP